MKNIKVDFITNTITITKRFYEESKEYGTEAYNTLKAVRNDNPHMEVVISTTNRKSALKGIDYRYMRRFIAVMDRDNLSVFESVIAHYEDLYGNNSTKVFNAVRTWFLDNYPDHNDMIVEAAPKRKAMKVVVAAPDKTLAAAV